MNLISLNTWGGRAGLPSLEQFFATYKNAADVFCLQEIWRTDDLSLIEARDVRLVPNLLDYIAAWLPEFQFYFRPQYRGIYGLATFVRKGIEVLDEGELFVFKEQGFENPAAIGNHARNIQHLTLIFQNHPVIVINFHGLWNGQGKSDTADRLAQSRKIADFIRSLTHPYILAGDFNLAPETESFRILAEACARDLVSEYGVTSTRSSFYPKPIRYADYILTGGGIGVKSFTVLPDEVSDHLALRLECTTQPS